MSERGWVYSNGEIVPFEEARYWPHDLAIVFGDMVFEATRTFNGRPFRLDAHLDRLYRSLRYARIDPEMTQESMRQASLDVLERNLQAVPSGSDVWIFHNVSRGIHPQFRVPERDHAGATVLIWTHELGFRYWADGYVNGVSCVTTSVQQMSPGTLDPRMKTRSRMYLALAEQEAHAIDPQSHALMLDVHGHIAEAVGANFMLVNDQMILTPRSGTGLAGVSLGTVRELAGGLDLEVREANLTLYDVYNADEAMLSSTPYSLLPVTRVNGTPIGSGTPGPAYRRLLAAWSDLVGVDIEAQATGLGT